MVTVRSSIKAMMGGCCWAEFDVVPLHCGSADLVSIFMASENSMTEIVHPVMVLVSTLCQLDVVVPEETLTLKLL